MKVTRNLKTRTTTITEPDGVVGIEAFTVEDCSILKEHAWRQRFVAPNPQADALWRRVENIFAALVNDTSAIILTTTDDLEP